MQLIGLNENGSPVCWADRQTNRKDYWTCKTHDGIYSEFCDGKAVARDFLSRHGAFKIVRVSELLAGRYLVIA